MRLLLLFLALFLFAGQVAAQQSIIINEVLPNPEGKDTEGEFIELKNTGNSSIDLSGYKLRDSSMKEKGRSFTLSGALLPGAMIVFGFEQSKISLNNDGDTIELVSPSGGVVSSVKYGSAREGESWGLTGSSYAWGKPSPGIENIVEKILEKAAVSKPIEVTPAGVFDASGQSKTLGWTFISAAVFVALLALFIPGNKKVVGWWNVLLRNRRPRADSKLGS